MFKPFLHYFATGSDTSCDTTSCQDYEECEFVKCVSEENQVIDLFKRCKLQPHKLPQYTLVTRLSSCWFRILFDNMKNDKRGEERFREEGERKQKNRETGEPAQKRRTENVL